MASTITIQQTINWAQAFVNYAPLTIGTGNEPAISNANTILQTILAPPFAWPWNRKSVIYTNLEAGQQDFTLPLTNFGFLEKASVYVANDKPYELEERPILGDSNSPSRPNFIAVQTDDGQGNITFRLSPTPDQPYIVSLIYQAAAPKITAVTNTWTPIPDYYEFIVNWGFLALTLTYMESPASVQARQLFVASLLSVAEGLSEEDQNIFAASWLGDIRQMQGIPRYMDLVSRARGI